MCSMKNAAEICSGKEVSLGIYKGKVLLVVNVASRCGFTESKYTQMTELYQKYREKGFSLLEATPGNYHYLINTKVIDDMGLPFHTWRDSCEK